MTADMIPHPAASRHAFRAQVCRLVDRLIGILDDIDGDADIEPSLGSPIPQERVCQQLWAHHADDDREESCEDEGAQCDDEGCADENKEASLCGVTFGGGTPGRGSLGEITYDLEDQCEDEGHDSDREPEVGE